MATNYKQISYGASGDEVKQLQMMLNSNGYSLDVDGNFGPKTQAAVKDYQQKNSLDVDGVVGKNTWGALSGGTKPTTSADNKATSAADMHFSYDAYEKSDTVKNAEALLAQFQQNKPGDFTYGRQSELDAIMDQYLNRDKFSYDLNGDAIYKQYAQQYAQQGKMAMMDTMGQAAAMTGGYGNSYAQSGGQQAHQGYLQQRNEVVPELYGMALDQYNMKGEQMLNQYGLLSSERDQEYGIHRDKVSDYYAELQRLTDEARYLSEDEYNKYLNDLNMKYGIFSDEKSYQYQSERDAVSDDQWERSFKYQKERDSIADQQWAKEFAEAQRQYNESKSNEETYVMSTEDYDYWNNQWAMVGSDEEAEALSERMEAAGVPFELVALWYKEYTNGYKKDEPTTDTTVSGGGGGGGGGGGTGKHAYGGLMMQ